MDDFPTAIAIDPKTMLSAIAYRDAAGTLFFAYQEANEWRFQEVVSSGRYFSLAFDPVNSTPAIAWNTTGDYNLNYYILDGEEWKSSILSYSDARQESLCFNTLTSKYAISYGNLRLGKPSE